MTPIPDSLRSAPLFRRVPDALLEPLVAAGARRALAAGDLLLRAGEPNGRLFIVLTGAVTVRIASGTRTDVHLGPGECVGELSVIDGSRVSSDVVAREPTTVLAMDRAQVWTLIDESAEVARNLLSILAGRVRHDDLMLSETSRLEMQFEHEATVDALTGVKNRRWLDRAFDEQLAQTLARDRPLSVLMIDLDHFKAVNDAHGHAVGDAVLRETARVLAAALRPRDLVARYGGEEFAALLPDTDMDEAIVVAERLRQTVHVAPADATLPIMSISIGVAAAEAHMTLDALLAAADAALYRAKQGGRNRVSA